MVTVLAVLGVLLVLFVAGVAATRNDVELADAPPDAADLDLPAGALGADDVRRVRFGVTLRGYRMSEVDALLERLAGQLEERSLPEDLASLEGQASLADDPAFADATRFERPSRGDRPSHGDRAAAPVAGPPAPGDDGA